ncbi:Ig-like domain-containing protein, partial [Candidatus Albibeggiatoa sp. nov. BB20]|uniref:NHL domain-containing protein n=1 Tax=Candidatus Albibeggiatoa sp. nov. BB20 TaxID=3162723 RepID=UPI003365A54F
MKLKFSAKYLALLLGCLTVLFFPKYSEAREYLVSTVAGTSRGYSGDGGAATAAELAYPYDVALDAAGNIYIADYGNHCIRKVDTSGIITTVAGIGTSGYSGDGGFAIAAELNTPRSVAIDSTGNIYIAEEYNHCIRKVDILGIISTAAGTCGSNGDSGDGGAATDALLKYPHGVAVDSTGNIYIADSRNFRVRKVDSSGIINTVAGSETPGFSGDGGLATSATFKSPEGVAVDTAGNIYISDPFGYCVRKVDASSSIVNTVAGICGSGGYSGDDGLATAAEFRWIRDITVDADGNLYMTDTNNSYVRVVDTAGIVTSIPISLSYPSGVIVDADGHIYVANSSGHNIRYFKRLAPFVSSITRNNPIDTNTNASSVEFLVTFSEQVTGVNTDDFSLNTSGVSGSAISSVSSSTCNPSCTVTVNTGTGNGTIRLDVVDDDSISSNDSGWNLGDAAGENDGGFSSGESYNIDKSIAAPSTPDMDSGSDSGSSNSDNITNNTTPTFTGTAEADSEVELFYAGSNSLGTTTADSSGDWTINATVIPNGSQNITAKATDPAGNISAVSSALSMTINNISPSVTINQASSQADPSSANSIDFSVEFSDSVTGFATGDVSISGTAGATTATVSGSGSSYNIAVTGMTNAGTVIANVNTGVASDNAGNTNTASSSTDNSVTISQVITNLSITNGNNQNTTVGTSFSNPLEVTVTDQYSDIISNAPVTFTAPNSSASLDSVSSNATTNSSGIASLSATANTISGDYSVVASSNSVTTDFSLSNDVDAVANLTISSGNNQSSMVGTAFNDDLEITVTDQYSNLIPSATVTFTAPNSGASLDSTSSNATTNSSGLASLSVTANASAGNYNVTASSNGINTDFSLSNTVPTISFTASSHSVNENSGSITITAQLSESSGVDVSLPFTVNASSTANSADYSISASPLTISAGDTSADISITIINDSTDEDEETLLIEMDTPSNATQGTTTSHNITIQDDDVSLIINELDYDQGATDSAEFIELKNINGNALDLAAEAYSVQLIDDTGVAYQSFNLSGTLANNGYYVLCDTAAKVLNCNQAVNLGDDFINDGAPNAVAIMKAGFIVDTVSYEGITPNHFTETDTAITDDGSRTLVGLSRDSSSNDTEDNSADFALKCVTPNADNALTDNNNCFQISIDDPSITENDSGTTSLDFTVSLSHAASSDVSVNYSTANNSAGSSDYSSQSNSITFSAATNNDQTISISVTGDEIDEGTSESFYLNLDSVSVNAQIIDNQGNGTITDDDSAGMTIIETSGTSVNESGTSDTFSVVLQTQPESNVELNLSSGDTAEATLLPTSLSFSNSDWHIAQTVTVTGVDDNGADGNQTTNITISVVDANSDDRYDALSDQTVTVTTVDNDTPAITVTPNSLSLSEPNSSDTFAITLNTLPTDSVDIPLTITGACSIDVSSPITINNTDWATGQTITVTAIDDAIDNISDPSCSIVTGDPSSIDKNYNNFTASDVQNVSVSITDNDTASVTVNPTSGLSINEPSETTTFNISLATEPESDVSINLTTSDECSAVAADDLTTANYTTGVTITVTATDDNIADGEQICTVETTLTGDTIYAAITPDNVTISVQDDDTAGISIDSSIDITESATESVNIQLDTEPTTGNVVINATVSDSSQCSLNPSSITLSDSSTQTINITAINDSDIEGNHSCRVSYAISSSGATEYPSSMSINNTTVNITDNDAGVIIEPSDLSIGEDGTTDSYTIRLST